MKVTKTIAQATAQLMADNRYLPQIKELKGQGRKLIEDYFNSLVPKEIIKQFKKYPMFFKTMSYHRINGTYHRFGSEAGVYFEDSIPDCENVKRHQNRSRNINFLVTKFSTYFFW